MSDLLELAVGRSTRAADGVLALTLHRPDGDELPAWEPGAHIELLLAPGLVRQYSLCGDPADRRRWRIAVLREPTGRGGSAYVHDRLTEGAPLQVRGPRNHFALRPAARYRFVAGGIGITPILPMLAQVERAGADWSLLYGGRTRTSMAFLDELSRYGDRVRIAPQDETGLLDLAAYLDAPDAEVYCCGPGPLIDAVTAHGPARTERFTAPAEDTSADTAFDVVLARTGRTLTVEPGRSVLKTLQSAGVEVLYSCGEGTCGTCETDVLEGVPDHRDSVLDEAERRSGETMMICVSRSAGPRLVLDL